MEQRRLMEDKRSQKTGGLCWQRARLWEGSGEKMRVLSKSKLRTVLSGVDAGCKDLLGVTSGFLKSLGALRMGKTDVKA